MRITMLFTLLLVGCAHVSQPQTCDQWTEQETEFVYSLVTDVLNRKDSMPNPNELTFEQQDQLKQAIAESANEIFNGH